MRGATGGETFCGNFGGGGKLTTPEGGCGFGPNFGPCGSVFASGCPGGMALRRRGASSASGMATGIPARIDGPKTVPVGTGGGGGGRGSGIRRPGIGSYIGGAGVPTMMTGGGRGPCNARFCRKITAGRSSLAAGSGAGSG